MPKLKIRDTSAINADYLRNLYNLIESGIANIELQYNAGAPSILNDGIVPQKSQAIEIVVPTSFSPERVDQIVNEMQSFSLLTHKTSIFVPDKDTDSDSFNYNNYTTDAFSYYNLRNEDYENYTQANDERLLPNFCLGALWTRIGSDTNQEQIDYYTMFGQIDSLKDSQILAGETPINNFEFDDEFLGDAVSGDYSLEDKVDYYKQMLISGSVARPEYRNANTHIYTDFDYNINDSSQIGNTPFFNRIKLPNFSPLATNPNNNFFEGVYPSEIVGMFLESSMSEKLIKSFRRSNSFMRDFTINGEETQLKVYDIIELFESISYGEDLRKNDEMFLRDTSTNYAMDDNSPFTFYFYKLLLLGKIRNTIKSKILDFTQLVVNNEDHLTDHVGFKVIKRIEGRNTPIQTFYFLNRSGLQDFIDTQVKFDRVYQYQIIAMFAVYGSNYGYENVVETRTSSLLQAETIIKFNFVNQPSVKIVEVPFADYTLRIVEPPPIVPEITFYNEMTSKNKLKIRMEHQDGNIVDEYMKKPLRPFLGNEQYISKLKQYFSSPNVLVTSGKTSDGVYEIYRLEEPPESYKDFEGALIATVQSNVVYSNGELSRNAMFIDMIKHQKKYYYAFRALTHRGNPSELSPTYVVEMYEDADETFLTFDLYQQPEINDSQNIYNMRKYIQIIPNFDQTSINEEQLLQFPNAEAAVEHVNLGSDSIQEKLFSYNNKSKYIKLRLESKSSGRKMDINLYFKIKT